MTRLLGIDLGMRRIGIAVADTETGDVRPLATVRRGSLERDAAVIGRLAAEQSVDELIVGLPRNMDGSEGPQAAATRAWAEELAPALGLRLCYRDERLTSERATQRLGRARRGRGGGPPSAAARAGRRADVDRQAAALIVQSELDARRPSANGSA